VTKRAESFKGAYTNGSPGYSGVPASGVGVTSLPGGLSQITWNGHPLYLFSNEALARQPVTATKACPDPPTHF